MNEHGTTSHLSGRAAASQGRRAQWLWRSLGGWSCSCGAKSVLVGNVLLMKIERRGCSGGDGTGSEICSVDDECTYSCRMNISWTCSVYAERAGDGTCRRDMVVVVVWE